MLDYNPTNGALSNAIFAAALYMAFTFFSPSAISSPGASTHTNSENPPQMPSAMEHNHQPHRVSYVCPMHPDEVSHEPGKCSLCGMFLVKQEYAPTSTEEMSHQHEHHATIYACPMHPDETSHEAGKCSQCGMFLVKQEQPAVNKTQASLPHEHHATVYACPMHPEETSDKPDRCPQCGMFLVAQDKPKEQTGLDQDTHSHPMRMPVKGKTVPYWDNPNSQTHHVIRAVPASATERNRRIPERLKAASDKDAENTQPVSQESPQEHAKKHLDPTYVCPMHPQIVSSDADSSCPICGMDLVEKQIESPSSEPQPSQGTTTYICPMHPQIMQHEPGGSCPICGMDLVAKENTAPSGDHPQVYLSAAVIQNMGVRTTHVARQNLSKSFKTQGIVTADDDRILNIHPRAAGWVENLYLVTEGDRVERKDEIIDFYSPWINQIQLQFIQALEEYDFVAFDPTKKTELGAKVDALRNSLRSLKISPMDLMRLEKGRKVLNTIQLMAPQGGLVTALNVTEGSYVEPYETMYTIVDLSEVWVMVDIYEHQAPWIRKGQEVSITAPAIPGRTWNGKVDFIYPEVDPKTRTLRARIEVNNADEALLLNMFVQVELTSTATSKAVLSVPREAVIVTGEREVVVLSQGKGHFQPVEVTTGIWSDDRAEILSGLTEGDEIVVSGQFLIDSESSLQASFLRMME